MWNEDDRKWLYEKMKGAGINTGSYADFSASMDNDADRDWYFKKAQSMGLNIGSASDFAAMMSTPKQQTPVVEQPQQVQTPAAAPAPLTSAQARPQSGAYTPSNDPLLQQMKKDGKIKPTIPSFSDVAELTAFKPMPMFESEQTVDANGNIVIKPKPVPTFKNGRMGMGYHDMFTGEYYDINDPASESIVKNNTRTYESMKNIAAINRQQVGNMTKSIDDMLRNAEKKQLEEGSPAVKTLTDEDANWFQKLGAAMAMGNQGNVLDNHNAVTANQMANAPTVEVQQLTAAKRSMRDAQRMIAEADKAVKEGNFDGFFKGAGRGFGNKLFDADTWDMGASDGSDAINLYSILQKADKGEKLTDAEQMLLDAKAVELATNAYFGSYVGRGYKAGEVTAESIPFMLEMCVNPASRAGQSAQGMLTRYALKRFGKQAVKNNVKKFVASKVATRVAGDLAGSAAMAATTGIGHVTAGTAERMSGDIIPDIDETTGETVYGGHTDGDDGLTALGKSFASTTIENYSEMVGEYFAPVTGVIGKGISKGMNKIGLKGVNDFMENVAASDVARLVGDFEKHSKWNGVFGEYAEEVAGNMMNALVVGDMTMDTAEGTGVFNLDQNIDTFLGVSIMGGFISGVKTLGYRTPKYRARKDMMKADDNAATLFTDPSDWGAIRNTIAFGSDEDASSVIADVLSNENLTEEQKKAVLKYANKAETYKGILRAEDSRRSEDVGTVDVDAETSYDNGYTLDTDEDMNDAKNMYDYKRQQMQELVTEDFLEQFDNDPVGSVAGLLNNDAFTEDEKQLALDYVNAKATYDGMLDRVRDDIDSHVEASNRAVDSHVNTQSGMIHPATLKLNDRKVYVVDGNLVMHEDGGIVDIANSSESILVRDAETGKLEWASPHDVLSVDEQIDPAEEKEAAQAAIREQYAQQKADVIDGVLPFAVGDTYNILDEQGQQHQAQILQDNGDGTVQVSYDGTEAITAPKAAIQDMAENANLARLQQFEQQRTIERQQKAAQEAQEQYEAQRPVYNLNDEITIRDDAGNLVRGSVTAEENEDGQIEVYTEFPVNGQKINLFTRDQLDAMVEEQNGVLVEPSTVQNDVENVSETTENVQNAAENVPASEETVAVEPMPMVKVRGKMKPDWGKATPARAHAYLYNERGLSRENANVFVENNRKAAASELEKLRKKKPEMGTDLDEFEEKTAEWQSKMDEAQRLLNYWNGVREIQNAIQRKENERRAAEEAERHEKAVAQAQSDFEARKKAEEERKAVGNENPMPAITEKWNSAVKIDGHNDEVVLPNGETIKGHYVLHESGASSPSHNPETWQKTDGFPMDANDNSVNDRDYERDHDAQEHTQSIARQYDQRALQSVPVVSNDGVVLSGNGRTMAGQLAARDNTDGAYVNYLKEYAPKFGFTPEQVEGMQHPRVSFVPDEAMPYTAETFAKFNQQDMKSQNKTEQAVKLGKTVGDDVFKRIVKTINGYETLGDFYNDANASLGAVYDLHRAGVIPQAQLAEMVDGVRGQEKLSAVGREFLENMLIGKAFAANPDVVRMLTSEPFMRQSIITALGEIADNIAIGGGWSLQQELADAVKLCFDARKEGAKQGDIVSIYAKQGVLFADPDQLQTVADFNNATMLMLADALNDKRVTLLKITLQLYNNDARESAAGQADLFAGGIRSREDILRDVIIFIKKNYGKGKEIEAARAAAVERRKADSVQQNGTDEAGIGGSENKGGSGRNETAVSAGLRITDPRTMSDEERQRRGEMLRNATAIDVEPNHIVSTKDKTARKAAEEWWDDNVGDAQWYETEAGEVEINRNSIESSLAHGYGQMKLDAITSLIDGFSNAVYLGTMPDSTRQDGVLNHYFAYPINYKGKRSYVFCRALHDNNTNRLYVHEVFVEDKIKKGNTLQTAASQPHGGISLYRDILANVLLSDGKESENPASDQEKGEKVAENQSSSGVQAALEAAEQETNTEPTEAQKEAGNYKKGHVKVDGFDITIENAKGSTRSGKDADGKEWSVTMNNTYGYIRGTEGVDGDHIDIFLSDDPANGNVFVIDQVKADGTFDEHKVMYGFASAEEARDNYLANYSEGWTGLGTISEVTKDEFKKWIESSLRKTKPFADYKNVKVEGAQNEAADGVVTPAAEKTDEQGNPLNEDGTLKLEKLSSIDEITDEDFSKPTRSVELPALPAAVDEAIGSNGKPVIIKKNIFERNAERHADLTADDSRNILQSALYNPNLYGQNQKAKRPYNWVVINTKDKEGNNRLVLLELSPEKENAEIVHWHYIDDKGLEKIKRQAEREDGQLLILPSESEEAGALSSPTNDLSSGGKVTNNSGISQRNGVRNGGVEELVSDAMSIGVEDVASFPKEIREEDVISKEQKSGKYRTGIKVKAGLSGNDLYIQYKSGRSSKDKRYWATIKIPNATNYSAVQIIYRLGYIGTFTDIERLAGDAVLELFNKNGLRLQKGGEKEVSPREAARQSNNVKKGNGTDAIEDVGEKIGGARKDKAAEMRERSAEMLKKSDESLESMLSSLSVSKVFNFDLAKLRADGISNEVISFIKSCKDAIPAKTRVAARKAKWVKDTLTIYKMCLMSFQKWDVINASLKGKYASSKFAQIFDAYMAVGGFDSGLELNGARLSQLGDSAIRYGENGEAISLAGKWYVSGAAKYSGIYDTREAAAEALKQFAGTNAVKNSEKPMDFVVYRRRADGIHFITPKGKVDIILQDGFKTAKDAREYINQHRTEMEERYRTMLSETKIQLNENRARKGRDHRAGKDVSAQEFMDTFGFRGVEFGNWTNQSDRASSINKCYDALMDLADVLHVSPKALSLGGTLAMAFGARGGGNFSAHFERDKMVINLTKTQGAGSLAHEWFHALDNYFAKMGGVEYGFATSEEGLRPNVLRLKGLRGSYSYYDTASKDYISEQEYKQRLTEHGVREEMADAWIALTKAIDSSEYKMRSRMYANLHSSNYWVRATELGARAFSKWVENELSKRNASNDYLANNPAIFADTASEDAKRFTPYPFDTDAKWMDEAFGALFATMQQRKDEATGNVLLYHKQDGSTTDLRSKEVALRDAIVESVRRAGVEVVTDAQEGQRVLDEANSGARMQAKKRALETVSVTSEEEHLPTVVSSADGAKVLRKLDEAKEKYENISSRINTFIGDIANALGAQRKGSKSEYATFETKNGRVVTIRLADHNATVSNFDRRGELDGISIVVSPKKSAGVTNDGDAHVVEYYYDAIKLRRADGKPLADIVRSIKQALYSGEFEDTTGLAERQEVNGRELMKLSGVKMQKKPMDAEEQKHKETQLSIINDTNPAPDDYHTWVRSIDDILTLQEAVDAVLAEDPEYELSTYPDVSDDIIREALRTGRITIYSSKPIKNGVFVTPSMMQAMDYSGGTKVFSKEVPIRDVAWLNTDEGQYTATSGEATSKDNEVRFFRTPDGHAYGFTKDGKIYIDPRIATAETPIHEYSHLWAAAFRKTNPKEWANIVELMKGTTLWEEVKQRYPELKTDDEIADEVLAQYSGRRGAERLRAEQEKIAKGEGDVFEKAEAISALERVKDALNRFWKGVADWLGIHFTSAEEVADKVLSDMLNGVNPAAKAGAQREGVRYEANSEEAEIVAKAKADGTYMKAPNGKASKLSPRQWVQVRTRAFKEWFGDWELASKVLKVVPALKEHGFKNFDEARAWAKEHIVRSLTDAETGGKGEIRISNNAVAKFLSESAVAKSDSKDVHLSVLKVLPEVIRESIDAEQHPDYKKGEDGSRSSENGVNEHVTIHRLYGAVNIDGNTYRVKVTLKEYADGNRPQKAYSYEATKIELLAGTLVGGKSSNPSTSNSITAAKLLENVEKSYGNGEKLLDCSKVVDDNSEPKVVYHGTRLLEMYFKDGRPYTKSISRFYAFNDGKGFFTDNEKAAQTFATGQRGMYNTYLYIKNPYVFDCEGQDWDAIKTYKDGETVSTDRIVYDAKQSGNYDGVILMNVGGENNGQIKGQINEAIPFSAVQIKSADENVGTFDGSNPDIRYQFVGEKGAAAMDKAEEASVRLDNLAVAREMEAAGKDAKTVKLATGWERGDDGKWMRREGDLDAESPVSDAGMSEMVKRVNELAAKLHLDNIEIVTDTSMLEGKKNAKGFYNRKTGKISIVVANHNDLADLEKTVLHESVAHHGLRQLLGEHFNTFLDNVFRNADADVRKRITELAAKHGWNFRTATEEYLAGLAEDTDFDNAKKTGWWEKVKRAFLDMLHRIGFDEYDGDVLTDNELRYILWRSYSNLENGEHGIIKAARNEVMKQKLLANDKPKTAAEKALDAIRQRVMELFEQAGIGEFTGKPKSIGRLSGEGKALLEKLSGQRFKEFVDFMLNPSYLNHIRGDHYGENEKDKVNNIPLTDEDMMNLVDVINQPDGILYGIDKKDGRKLFFFLKDAGNGLYNLTEVCSTKKGNITAKSFFKTKKKGINQRVMEITDSLLPTSVTYSGEFLSSGAKLPNMFDIQKDMDENVEEDDIFFRDGDPEERNRTDARYWYEQRVKSGMYQTREAMLDSMLGLHEAMKAIYGKDVHIEDIADFENAYLGENRLSSINQDEWDSFEHLLIKPLLKEVSKLEKDGSSREEVTRYMMAKHGLERNEVMAARAAKKAFESEDNKDESGNHIKSEADFLAEYRKRDFGGITGLMEKDDLGIAEGLARQLVADFENKHDTTELWAKVHNVNKAILSKQYECGMMNKETYDDISSMYEFYIPLRGFAEKTSEEAYAYLTSKNSAFNAPIKKAHGRKSVADDPIVNLQTMAQSSILMGNRNKLVKQRFLNFVLNHPSDLVSVNDLWVRYDDVEDEWKAVFPDNINDDDSSEVVEQKMKDFEEKMQQLAEADPDHYKRGKDTINIPYRVVGNANLRQHQVLVKRNGRDYVLTINGNPRAAQALNGLTNPDNEQRGSFGSILHAVGAINRTLSGLYTTMSIDFVASNFMRDTVYSNSMVWIKESPRYAAKFNWNYVKTKRVKGLLAKYRKGTLDMNNETEKMFYQFMKNGGETGYMRMADIDEHRKQIKKALKVMNGKIPAHAVRELITTWIGEVGRGIEMRARFAAFITSREMGRTIGRSIWDAKEISVNFNKKGAGDKFIGATGQTFMGNTAAFVSGWGRAAYLFWNAALQGTFGNFGKYAMRHKGKAATAVALTFGLGLLVAALAAASGDDDDDSYFDQPEHIRRQNIVFKLFGKTWGKIPLPIELRAIYGLGELAGCVIFNHEKLEYDKLAKQLSQVLPVDLLEGYNGLIPSSVKPAIEADNNESWYGTPIWKDTPYNKHMPEWTKSYKSTDQRLVALSETLNEMSGGSKYKKGAIDINPAKMEYLLKQYSGGLFTLANQLGSMYDVATGDKEFDWRYAPILNRMFMTGGDERNVGRGLNEKFFKYMDAYDAKASEFSAIKNDLTIPMDKKAELISEIVSDPEYMKMRRTKHVYSKMNQAYKQAMELGNTDAADHLLKEMNKLKRKFIDEMEADDDRK